MDKAKLLTTIIVSKRQNDQQVIQVRSGLSSRELTDVVASLQQLAPRGLDLEQRGEEIVINNPDQETGEYLSGFGGNNYLLARLRTGRGYRHLPLGQPGKKQGTETDNREIHFFYPWIDHGSIRRYFSKNFQPAVGIESAAQGIVRLSQIRERSKIYLYSEEGCLAYEGRFGIAAGAAQRIGLTELGKYLQLQHLKELSSAGETAVKKGWERILTMIAQQMISDGVEKIEMNAAGGTEVYLSTTLNSYIKLFSLERKLSVVTGETAWLNCNHGPYSEV